MEIYTKEELIERMLEIRSMGWIPNARPGNAGGVGNTLEDLLGIRENNLPIPNSGEWELKCQRIGTSSLTTLFHMEPSPRALKLVPGMLLPQYGWPHQKIPNEWSFRQTIGASTRSDRGFMVVIDRDSSRVLISFDANAVDPRHNEWLRTVETRIGLAELNPQPYWGFADLRNKAGTKLLNCFYVQARVKREGGREYFHYDSISVLKGFRFESFLRAMEENHLLVDFDARSGHNHGTKFRLRQDRLAALYETVSVAA